MIKVCPDDDYKEFKNRRMISIKMGISPWITKDHMSGEILIYFLMIMLTMFS
jgi:hypothetical protein